MNTFSFMRPKALIILSAMTLALFTIVSCTRQFKPQEPCNFVQNSELQRVSWNKTVPIKLYVHKSVPVRQYPEMKSVLEAVVESWNREAGRDLFVLQAFDVDGDNTPKKDGYSMIYWMDTWEDKNRLEQARTTIYWTGSQIFEADIRINARDHHYYVGHDTSFTGVDFKSLMIHEFGHVLGLAHNSQKTSVMNVTLNEGIDRREISQIDKTSISCEYKHL